MTFPGRAVRAPLPVRVSAVADVSRSMREISLTGPDVAGLRFRAGAHLVVRLPARRVYSIWSHRGAVLTVRVALHDAGGPGCDWARTAAAGDRLTIEPPRSKITVDGSARHHLFVGDETGAVPLLAMRATLPGAATALGVFECATGEDEMPGPEGVPPVSWVHRGGAPAVASRVLLRAVQELNLPAGSGTAYVAGESDTCRLIQRHLIERRGFARRAVLLQPQWAPGRPGFGTGGSDLIPPGG